MGKAWPDKCKREDDPTESIPDDQRFAKRKQVQTYSRLCSSWSRIQIPRKRIKAKDAKVIATVAVSRSATITDAKAVGAANKKVETTANKCNMQTQQLLLDRNEGEVRAEVQQT